LGTDARDGRSNRRSFLTAFFATGVATAMRGSCAYAAGESDGLLSLPSGRRLGYRFYGQPGGLPVLYFHGTPSCRLEAQLISSVCREHQVWLIAVDRPGIGLSTYLCSHRVATWPDDIVFLLDALQRESHLEQVGILSYSGGMPFALACAEQLADRIFGAAILSPRAPGAPGVPSGVLDRDVYFVSRRPRLAQVALNRQIQGLRRRPHLARSPQIDRLAGIDQRFAAQNAGWLRQCILEAARCSTAGIVRDISLLPWPWSVQLENIRVPIACWQGLCDLSAPEATGHFLGKQIPKSVVTFVQGQGHLTLLYHLAGTAFDWLHSVASKT
jgi:pimeloyl-ACP methyl ester carboxylesterase